jgi:transcriptional regulator with XRE-family HTH domain
MATVSSQPGVGPLVREWRKRRRLSQLELALDAGISARHLSFVETGRSNPTAEMVLLLAEQLEVPLRERNHLLLAAGHAPAFPERSLEDPELAPVREALDLILSRHEPYPALVIDGRWNIVAANSATLALAEWLDPALLEPPNTVQGLVMKLAPMIVNLAEVRAYFVERIRRQLAITGDEDLAGLLEELASYPVGEEEPAPVPEAAARGILMPLRLRAPGGGELSFFATVATFGTALDVTTSELSIESAFPADPSTVQALIQVTQSG